jgi:threonine/homoserine/homoserine lactone efflux protein
MDIEFLARGFIIGLSVAAPVGPIGVLCIRRTLANGRMSGLVTGLGAATADAFYGAIAAFGLTAISRVLLDNQDVFRIVGGVALLYLGVRTFLSRPSESASDPRRSDLARDFASALGLTLANPATILSSPQSSPVSASQTSTPVTARRRSWSRACSPAPRPGGSSSAAVSAFFGPGWSATCPSSTSFLASC